MTEQTSVIDLVSEPRYQAMFALRSFFEVEANDLNALEPWVPVILTMMQLPPQIMQEVGISILERFFEEESLDPGETAQRKMAEPFVPLLSASIETAARAIFQQMQHQAMREQQTRAKLANGLLGS